MILVIPNRFSGEESAVCWHQHNACVDAALAVLRGKGARELAWPARFVLNCVDDINGFLNHLFKSAIIEIWKSIGSE